jgi:hypothetical protein
MYSLNADRILSGIIQYIYIFSFILECLTKYSSPSPIARKPALGGWFFVSSIIYSTVANG